jgi:hypothetical protein
MALDGYFAVPRERFGCPPLVGPPDRTIAVSCLPKVSLPAFSNADLIQPGQRASMDLPVDADKWFGWALQPATDEELAEMACLGREHALRWLEDDQAEVSDVR